MPDWISFILKLVAAIFFVSFFVSLGSKNLGKSMWENLKLLFFSFVILLGIVFITVFTITLLGKDYWPVSAGIMFILFGLAMVVGAPYMERVGRTTAPARVQEIQKLFYAPGQRAKSFRFLGWFVILFGLLFFSVTPFLDQTEPKVILGGFALVVINAGAALVTGVGLISIVKMKRSFPRVVGADQKTLMEIWPPFVIPLLGPGRAPDWELFKRRLFFQKKFRIRDAFAAAIPDQKIKRVFWVTILFILVLFLFRPWFFLRADSPPHLVGFVMDYKFSIMGFWSIAFLVAYFEGKIRRPFMAALVARVDDLDPTEKSDE